MFWKTQVFLKIRSLCAHQMHHETLAVMMKNQQKFCMMSSICWFSWPVETGFFNEKKQASQFVHSSHKKYQLDWSSRFEDRGENFWTSLDLVNPKTSGKKHLTIFTTLWQLLIYSPRSMYLDSFINFRSAIPWEHGRGTGSLKSVEIEKIYFHISIID